MKQQVFLPVGKKGKKKAGKKFWQQLKSLVEIQKESVSVPSIRKVFAQNSKHACEKITVFILITINVREMKNTIDLKNRSNFPGKFYQNCAKIQFIQFSRRKKIL